MAEFFTSDLHFHHKNILKFENRPYNTVEEMNQGLIDAWNRKVKDGDTVYNIGDFCFGGYDKWVEILEQLNGNIIHIKGNHDSKNIIKKLQQNGYLKQVHMIGHYMKVGHFILHLTHYPMDIGIRPRMYSLHGHIHSQESKMINQINLCVDSPVDFGREFGEPIPLEKVVEYIEQINPIVEKNYIQGKKN